MKVQTYERVVLVERSVRLNLVAIGIMSALAALIGYTQFDNSIGHAIGFAVVVSVVMVIAYAICTFEEHVVGPL